MKLAIIRRRYTPYGGAERFIERISNELRLHDVNTTIVAERWNAPTEHEPKLLEVRTSGLSRASRFQSFAKAIQSVISEHKFDIVQSHERLLGADIYRLGDGVHQAWINRLSRQGSRWLGMRYKYDPFHTAVLSMERKMAADPRLRYVANSELVSEEIQDILQVPAERITLIPNGVNTQYFSPPTPEDRRAERIKSGLPKDAFVVGFVGSGFERKGLFQLIKSLQFLPDTFLLCCGKDREHGRLINDIASSDISKRVFYLGAVTDVKPLLWSSDVFALPSLYDPSSNAVLEALSCGLPVTTTKDVGTANKIVSTESGIICTRDPESIAEKINFFKDATRRTIYASNARALAKQFDQERVMKEWLFFYNKFFL